VTTQNASPSLTNEPQLPQLFAIKVSALIEALQIARDNDAHGQLQITASASNTKDRECDSSCHVFVMLENA
jgi:hypothetical protein